MDKCIVSVLLLYFYDHLPSDNGHLGSQGRGYELSGQHVDSFSHSSICMAMLYNQDKMFTCSGQVLCYTSVFVQY